MSSRSRLVAGAALVGLVATLLPAAQAAPPDPRSTAVPLYPAVGEGTSFVDQDEALAGMAEPDWYKANVPFVDLPDAEIEDTYYYRWQSYKEALKYTGPEDGWIVSEFLGPVGYSAPSGGIAAAAGPTSTRGAGSVTSGTSTTTSTTGWRGPVPPRSLPPTS